MNKINKNAFFSAALAAWLLLWIFFIAREDKEGQYSLLHQLYTSRGVDKTRHIFGVGFYNFLVSCRSMIPAGTTYELVGFEKYSIDEVRARYLLWPLKAGTGGTELKIAYSGDVKEIPGYELFMNFGEKGKIFKKMKGPK